MTSPSPCVATWRVPQTGRVPSALPDGEPVPADGALPADALTGLGTRPFGLYLHVPFCASRCGYCDFNTYVGSELGGGALQASYADTAALELRSVRAVLGDAAPPVDTVFVGGGTPTLLKAADLGAIVASAGPSAVNSARAWSSVRFLGSFSACFSAALISGSQAPAALWLVEPAATCSRRRSVRTSPTRASGWALPSRRCTRTWRRRQG